MTNKYIKAFVAGSAFPVILSPMLYLGIPVLIYPDSGFNYVGTIITIALIVGSLNMFFILIRDMLPYSNKLGYLFFGAAHGFILSLFGNFFSSIPTELYMLVGPEQYLTIPAATILYALIWRYIIRNLNIMLGIER